jgi:lysophospholipase L1-like esterase
VVERGGADPMTDGGLTAAAGKGPVEFSAAVPEGTYWVTVGLGDAREATVTTIKAEARRLMALNVRTAPGEFVTRTFAVAVKRPGLRAGGAVKLKPDEQGHRDWDEKLTLEFAGEHPGVCSVQIEPAPRAGEHRVTTIFIAGDSTVTDQRREPYAAWGQMLPAFFTKDVAVANHAESGESLRSSLGAHRFDKIWEQIQPGDFLFIQFGHNDQKDKTAGAGPFTTYKATLISVIQRAKELKAIPVVVTSMERRKFEGGQIVPSLTDYAEAARQAAREQGAELIDLHTMSVQFYEALGEEASMKAFVHFPAGTFPGQKAPLKDNTHFTAYGAYELARCVVAGLAGSDSGLSHSLDRKLWTPFDPKHPDRPEDIAIPASRLEVTEKPEGN